ncbi:cytochrome c-type biogenesis protein CcdA [Natronomonas moolapensis 8.8.11]|uniref:Cytochrome c-type biogenesis protein CcdA n=1 Tax=Natronomonas moolapensis (strain DSM 18674 / CECT 7526 / JCM 14361 / 8.8.11) TaxID=268739 RepID=M1XLA1_NATM8|nr:cytochrome c biogenesis CcdA family protein [Natronomonas moolapensis]CCQ37349.1 cytochrome c-type biogenesis protein CcdA [Natronomonas moolapensis 8.8.11]
MLETPGVAAVLLAGVLTALTPCCLPMLPPLLAGSAGHRLRPIAIVAGSILSFTGLGVSTAAVGSVTPETFRLPFVLAIIAFGAVLADDDLHEAYTTATSRLTAPVTQFTTAVERAHHPLVGGFVLGLFLGIIWLPCVGPILGSVLAYVGASGDVTGSATLLFAYGVGFSGPLLVVAYGGRRAGETLTGYVTSLDRPSVVRRLSGYALVATGVALLFELDKVLLAALVG